MSMPNRKRGFTLVELAIAMTFLAVLLITIAILTMNIINIYQKGLSIKAITATGRELIDDFSRAIAASPSKNPASLCDRITGEAAKENCFRDSALNFTFQQETSRGIVINGDNESAGESLPVRGAFCTGRYSYIWNTGYTFKNRLYSGNDNLYGILRYKIGDDDTIHIWPGDSEHRTAYHLLKIEDQDRTICAAHVNNSAYTIDEGQEYDLTATPFPSEPEELLDASEDNLALYDFRMFPPSQHATTLHTFYSGTFILATISGGVNIIGAGDYCTEAPAGLSTDFAYCAINKFNFAMRAIGELNNDEKEEKQRYEDQEREGN